MLGTVKSFSSQRGFGFIQPDGNGEDVFCHFSSIDPDNEGYKVLHAGQRVEFSIEKDDNNRDQAMNIVTDLSELVTEF